MMITQQRPLLEELQRLRLEIVSPGSTARLMSLVLQPTLLDRIREKQSGDPYLLRIREQLDRGQAEGFAVDSSGVLRYRDRLCVPMDSEIREDILREAHCSPYTVHPGGKPRCIRI